VALAASVGGLDALSEVLAALPADFPAPIVLVLHISATSGTMLPHILGRRTQLRVKQAETSDRLCRGTVYTAPPDMHLLVKADGILLLTHTERVHFTRPSADTLFESVADSYRERAIAVVLTGTGCDGGTGVQAIHDRGGTVIVQDEASSHAFGMPGNAINTGIVDHILSLKQIPLCLMNLVTTGEVGEA